MNPKIPMCSLALRLFGRKYPGDFIGLEVIVASGKSTLSRKLYDEGILKIDNFRPIHEPGTTSLAEGIRSLVQGKRTQDESIREGLSPLTSFLLYSAARASLFDTMILPGSRSGQGFFSDRGWPSSWAYQGAEGVPLWFIFLTSMHITGWLIPDIILYTDFDRYDQRDAKYFERVKSNYDLLGQAFMGMRVWEKLDGTKSLDEVVAQATRALRVRKLIK